MLKIEDVRAAAKAAAPSAEEIDITEAGPFWSVMLQRGEDTPAHKITTFTIEKNAPADFLPVAAENAARMF